MSSSKPPRGTVPPPAPDSPGPAATAAGEKGAVGATGGSSSGATISTGKHAALDANGRPSSTPSIPVAARRTYSGDSFVAQRVPTPPFGAHAAPSHGSQQGSLSSTSMTAQRSSPSSRPPPPTPVPLSSSSGTFRAARAGDFPTLPQQTVRRDSPRPPRAVVDFGLMTPATRVVEDILGLLPGERFLVVHDTQNLDIARAFEQAGEARSAHVERIDLEALMPRPWSTMPASLMQKIRASQASAFAVHNEDGEYALRASFVQAATAARLRHVHMVGLSRRVFQASMVTPCARIFELQRRLRTSLRPTSKISVRSANGTQLEIEMASHLRWMDNGSAIRPGEWATLPFGSLVSSPAVVNGVYVADASMSGPLGTKKGLLNARSVRLTFEASRLRRVETSDSEIRDHVERFAAEGQGRDRVGMVVLGANVGLMPPTGEFIHDEHTPGVHIGLGENFSSLTGATWTAQGQLAFAMAAADVDVDGTALIRQGRYVRFL